MIRPITTEELLNFMANLEHMTWEGWLVGAVMKVVLLIILTAIYRLLAYRLNQSKTRIVFIPAMADSSNYERMEEFFSFLNSLLRPKTLIGGLLPYKHIAVEITTNNETGLYYQLFVPPPLSAAIIQGMKGIFPGSRVHESELNNHDESSIVRHFKLRYISALPLRFITKEHVSDPSSFVASSLAELSEDEQATIQVVLTPLRGIKAWRLHHTEASAFGSQSGLVENKLRQPLFATCIRIRASKQRLHALTSAVYGVNQSRIQELQSSYIWPIQRQLVNWSMTQRNALFSPSSVLSIGEMASLLHPATGRVAKAEDVQTNKSSLLPLPTPLKVRSIDSGVVIGSAIGSSKNYPIVVTDDDRSRHMYLLGQTGSGKSTILFHMATKDIADGHGVAVIDPHGDLIDDIISDLVTTIGRERVNEVEQRVILIDPSDLLYPVGINLMELPKAAANPDELELEKELVCEGVISVFKRVFDQDEETNAHRIEYILRNVIHTAFHIEDATIFTLYNLLNDTKYRKQVIKSLTDTNLVNFWKNEFHKSGDWQQVKMVSGVTAKIGRFLFSPTVKRILEQPQSTIDFDDVLVSNKVLLCNLSEGKIGEDNAHLMGSVIVTKLHLAALRRARLEQSARSAYYLYVDEFQHFATNYFTRLLSGGRKFGLRVIIAQQSTAQIKDKNMLQVILANAGTVVAFRTASSMDAAMLLPLFEPMLGREDIVNLPRYSFYIKMGANEPLQAFSGRTSPINVAHDAKARQHLIELSRAQYAKKYQPIIELGEPTKATKTVSKSPKSIAAKLNRAV